MTLFGLDLPPLTLLSSAWIHALLVLILMAWGAYLGFKVLGSRGLKLQQITLKCLIPTFVLIFGFTFGISLSRQLQQEENAPQKVNSTSLAKVLQAEVNSHILDPSSEGPIRKSSSPTIQPAPLTEVDSSSFSFSSFATWKLPSELCLSLGALYTLGLLIGVLLFLRDLQKIKNERRDSELDSTGILQQACVTFPQSCRSQLSTVELRFTDSPSCRLVGLIKPTILLSRSLKEEISSRELQLILRHELWHHVKNDLRWAFLWRGMRTVFWCVPFIKIFAQRQERLAELLCDQSVIQDCPDPKSYVETLVKAWTESQSPQPLTGPSSALALDSKKFLSWRVKMILTPSKVKMPQKSFVNKVFTFTSLCLALFLISCAPWITIKTDADDNKKDLKIPNLVRSKTPTQGESKREPYIEPSPEILKAKKALAKTLTEEAKKFYQGGATQQGRELLSNLIAIKGLSPQAIELTNDLSGVQVSKFLYEMNKTFSFVKSPESHSAIEGKDQAFLFGKTDQIQKLKENFLKTSDALPDEFVHAKFILYQLYGPEGEKLFNSWKKTPQSQIVIKEFDEKQKASLSKLEKDDPLTFRRANAPQIILYPRAEGTISISTQKPIIAGYDLVSDGKTTVADPRIEVLTSGLDLSLAIFPRSEGKAQVLLKVKREDFGENVKQKVSLPNAQDVPYEHPVSHLAIDKYNLELPYQKPFILAYPVETHSSKGAKERKILGLVIEIEKKMKDKKK